MCELWYRPRASRYVNGRGASFEEVADVLGNSPAIVRKHYGKWSAARQSRIDDLMERVYIETEQAAPGKNMVQ